MIHAHAGASRLVRQWEMLTWLRQGHSCSALKIITPSGEVVTIYPTTSTVGHRHLAMSTPEGASLLDPTTDLAGLLILIENLPGYIHEEE